MVEKSAMGEEVEESLAMNTVHHGDEFETEKGPLAVENVVVLPALRRPLENSWTFWFDNPSAKSKHAAWAFSTVDYFWSVYNDIQHPSKLAVGANLHCFKNKIEPKWKDPICVNGGKYVRGKSDASWLYTLLAMIGEQFDYGDEICGAVVNVRSRQEKISIWTKNAANEAALMSIGRQLKEFLDSNEAIGYTLHNHGSGGARNRCCIV